MKIFLFFFFAEIGLSLASGREEIKVSLGFPCRGFENCQMALTQDSVGILENDESNSGLEPDDENGFAEAVTKHALTESQKDSAQIMFTLIHQWKGLKRFSCDHNDGYHFSVWSDSLALHCNNCFSCTDGITIHDAKTLAKFGRLAIWLYQIR